MGLLRAVAVALLSISTTPGCASAPPPKDDAHAPAASPPPSALASGSAASAPSGAPAASELPATALPAASAVQASAAPRQRPLPPAGVEADRFAILADLCRVAVWRHDSRVFFGCRSTPPFDGPNEGPDGSLLEARDLSEVCFLENFYRGAFTGPGKDEVILGLAACGEERWNDITPGNVVLAENSPSGWRVTAVQANTNIRDCRQWKRSDRTVLLCEDNFGALGDGSIAWRFTLDFTKPAGARNHVFSKIYQSAPGSCVFSEGVFEERGAISVKTTRERFEDLDGDGDEDLAVTVERASAPPNSPSLVKRVAAICAKDPQDRLEPAVLAGKSKRFELRFDGDGETLTPTPATAQLLKAWGDESPEFWLNQGP